MGNKNANDEHIDVNECINISTPELTVDENTIVPIERVNSLHKRETLDQPNNQSLESGQLEVELVFAKLVYNDNELEDQSQCRHCIIELSHYIDIVQRRNGLLN